MPSFKNNNVNKNPGENNVKEDIQERVKRVSKDS
jgi:hypothetical protein